MKALEDFCTQDVGFSPRRIRNLMEGLLLNAFITLPLPTAHCCVFRKTGQAKAGRLTVLAKDIADEGPLSKLHKALFKPYRDVSSITLKWAKYLNRCLIKGDVDMEKGSSTGEGDGNESNRKMTSYDH